MNRYVSAMMAAATICLASCASMPGSFKGPVGQCTPRPEGEGWIDLFAPENQAAWKNVTDDQNVFEFVDGGMRVIGTPGTEYFAWTKQEFSDFELHVEFKLKKDANSGVFFRTSPDDPVQKGMEIQVYGDYGEAPNRNGSGALYDVASPMFNMLLPYGEWNSYDITCKGASLVVVMNGWKVLDLDLSKMTTPIGKFATPLAQLPQTGHIILQDHGAEVFFRNLVVRPL
jgi:hypothetical protein